jgi:hypothetical protein
VSISADCAETFPPIEKQFGIIRSTLGNKVEEELNVSIHSESLSPVFHFNAGVDAAVALSHFHLGLFEVRRF